MSLRLPALLVLLWALAAPPAAATDWSEVRIGSEGAYPPFNYLDSNNRLQGFEIDIALALCSRMQVKCEFVQQDWEDMIPALLANKYDAIMASMSITEERRRKVDFTRKYYDSPAAFVARKASNLRDTSPQAMAGRVLGAQAETTQARLLEEVYAKAGATVRAYATQQEAQIDLARGRIDALLANKVVMLEWLQTTKEGECCAFAGGEIRDPKYLGEGVGVAVRKTDGDLKRKFDQAIEAILADGTYKRINDKYFPFSVY